jgi:hypothetical protein
VIEELQLSPEQSIGELNNYGKTALTLEELRWLLGKEKA